MFLRIKIINTMDYENSLKGKKIIVTGANTGIGYEAALDFAKRGNNQIYCANQNNSTNQNLVVRNRKEIL